MPSNGTMMAVGVMPDGTILGVGTDNQLHTRNMLTSPAIADATETGAEMPRLTL